MELPKRKPNRLKDFDYNTPGYYFITICTKEKRKILGEVVGTGVLDGPSVQLSPYGKVAEKQLCTMGNFYDDMVLEKYVIMPNHIHMLLHILDRGNGPSGRPVPTNSKVASFVGTFKRFCNRLCGTNMWQYRFHDHIVRGEDDYLKIWNYIDTNPAKWTEDCFYIEE